MRLRRPALVPCLGAVLALWVQVACADPIRPDDGAPAAAHGEPDEARDEESDEAAVVLIGQNAETSTLVPLLVELLGRQRVQLRFLSEPQFQPRQLLMGGEADRAAWVFIELTSERGARLYFRGPHARRFLLRELELRDGLDEFGRELVGQVVESSVVTLLRSSAGMSREQARAALSSPSALPWGSAGESLPAASPPATPASVARFAGWMGLSYEAQWSGSDLGGAHGPGLEAGIEWQGAVELRAGLSVHRWFSQTFASPEIKADIQTWPLLLSVDLGVPVARRQTVLVGLAGGASVIHVEPGPAADPSVTPAAPTTHLVPALRTALRYEFGGEGWSVGVAGFADISVMETHYDLQRGASADRVAVPMRVRPGAALVVAWWPSRPKR